jgi:hypothetical protein
VIQVESGPRYQDRQKPRPRAGVSLSGQHDFAVSKRKTRPRYHFQEPRPRAGVSLIASTSPRETQAQAGKLHRRTVKRHKCEEDAIALLILCKGLSWPGTQMSDLYKEQRCE